MCLAAPVKIVEFTGNERAIVDKNGVRFSVSTSLFPHMETGDYVLVHAGFVIQKIDTKEAEERIDMIDELYRSEA